MIINQLPVRTQTRNGILVVEENSGVFFYTVLFDGVPELRSHYFFSIDNLIQNIILHFRLGFYRCDLIPRRVHARMFLKKYFRFEK